MTQRISRRGLAQVAGAATVVLSVAAPADSAAAPETAKSGVMTRGYAKGPYGQIHFQDGGSGRPLVMIHQAPMSSRQFESVYGPLMARGIRPIGIDCPGFGMSDVTPFVPKVEDWAKVVPPVLDHLKIRQTDVLGHHTGSLVATEVEQQFPDRVRRLVMAGPLPLTDSERAKFLAGAQSEVDFVYEPDGSHLQKAFMTRYRMYGGAPTPDPKLITRYTVERFVGNGPFWYGHHAAFVYDHNVTIPKIKHPTLIMTNTGDQIYENAKLTKKMRPDFTLVELQGGGVDIVDQQPEAWSDAVAKFLNS